MNYELLGVILALVGLAVLVGRYLGRALIKWDKQNRAAKKVRVQACKTDHKARVLAFFEILKRELKKEGIGFVFDSVYRSGYLPTLAGRSILSASSCGVFLRVEPDEHGDSLCFRLHHPVPSGKNDHQEKAHAQISWMVLHEIGWDQSHSIEQIENFGSHAVARGLIHEWLEEYEHLWSLASIFQGALTMRYKEIKDADDARQALIGILQEHLKKARSASVAV